MCKSNLHWRWVEIYYRHLFYIDQRKLNDKEKHQSSPNKKKYSETSDNIANWKR